jgi:glycosyltransferase involved in cell wall biosynthesis
LTATPLISIIVSVYNGEKTIANAIDSVLNQDYASLELVIINDGSTDTTEEIIKGYADPRIKYFPQENTGVSKARNKGLDVMTGDYFCFLDADDLLPPTSISARVKVFINNPTLSFVDGTVEERDLSTGKLLRRFEPTFKGNPLKELLLLNDSCFCGQTWMVKHQKENLPRFNEDLTHGEDLHFFIACAQQGGAYDFTKELTLIYNRHEGSAMGNLDGLHRFYDFHLASLPAFVMQKVLTEEEVVGVKKKVKSILVKSYLKSKKLTKAISTIFSS